MFQSQNRALNSPYGNELVQRLTSSEGAAITGKPTLRVSDIIESDLINIATGVYSPLIGFMDSANFESVCERSCLADSKLPWTIPILFDISAEDKKTIAGASLVYLISQSTGKLLGFIEPAEIYAHDKEKRIRGTYGVNDLSHPGVKLVKSMGEYLLAGNVTVYRDALSDDPLAYPVGVRAKLLEMGITQIVGFQTRNVVHRAHEYLQRVGLEVCAGLLVQPVIGWKKPGDFQPEAVQHAYRHFIREYYPANRVLLTFLKVAMRYAGPKEAVFHAIIRKNYGCSHFIVGRDHAGVGGFYGTYAAHEIFDTLPEFGIEILKLREPFYCKRCDSIASDRTCGHTESDREYISGTKIRKILTEGADPGNHIFRREVLESLKELGKDGLFYE